MTPREQIESKRETIAHLCRDLAIPGLTVYFLRGSDSWKNAVFVADLDPSRLKGYAHRFFSLEEGLLRIFHRRIEITEIQMFSKLYADVASAPVMELLRAS